MVGGTDYEGELAAARLRFKLEQTVPPLEADRLRQAESREQLVGRILVLALMMVIYGLVLIFG